MTDAFEEVEETIRRERLATLVRRFGPAFGIVFALIVLGILGWEGYKSWRLQQGGEIAIELAKGQELMATGDVDAAMKAFTDVAQRGAPGYKALAKMEEAGVHVAKGDYKAAIAAFDAAAGMTKDPLVRDSATLRAAYLVAETEPVAAVEARVKPMIDSAGAFAFLARELIALKAMEAGDTAKAREHLEFLTLALDAPEGVRQRAQSALALLGPKPAAAAPAAATPAPATPAPAPAAP